MHDFDTRAKQWDENPLHLQRTQAIALAMRERLPLSKSMRSLEVGCGTGLLSFELREELGPITLADTSAGMLEVLREKIIARGATSMEPRLLDLSVDKLPAESFDMVYLQMALHHIPDVEGILRTFYELLAPGGYLAVADLVVEDGSFHGHGFEGHHGFDPLALAQQVAAPGFLEVESETVYQLQREIDGQVQLFPIFLMTARKPLT